MKTANWIGGTALASLLLVAAGAAMAGTGNPLADAVKAANNRFEDVAVAVKEGYGPIPCDASPMGGGMGIHYVNGAYLKDGVLDISKPEAVMYEPTPDGKLKLIAVEYISLKGPVALKGHMMNYNSDDEMDEEDNADRVWKEQLDLFGEGRGWRKENKAAFIRRWKEAKRTEGQVTANNIWDQLAAENMNDGKIGFYEDFDNNRNAAGGDIPATLEWLYGSAFRAALWADIELVHPLEGLVIPALRQPFTWQRICLCKQVKQAIARNNANAPGVAEVVSAALELAVVDCPLHGHCVMCEMSKGDCFCVLWQMWHVCRHCHHQVLVCQCQPRPFQKCMQQHAPPP